VRLTVVNPLKSKNPWLHIRSLDLGNPVEHSEFIVQDSESGPDDFIPICQMCSIMSVLWVMGEVGDAVPFGRVSQRLQEKIVGIAAENSTNELQFAWARGYIHFHEIDAAAARNLPVNAKLLLYGPGHVTALEVVVPMQVELNAKVYDPETASVEYWNLSVWIERSEATGFLSSSAS
jgi:hypothetical protein